MATDWIEDEFEYFVVNGSDANTNRNPNANANANANNVENEDSVSEDSIWEIITNWDKLRKYWAEALACITLVLLSWIWGLPFLEYYFRLGKRFLYLLSFAIPILAVWGFGKVNKTRIAKRYYNNRPSMGTGSGSRSRNVSSYMKKFVASSQQWHCALCGTMLDATYEIDHILPLYRGGTNTIENLQACCPNCHRQKTIADSIIA